MQKIVALFFLLIAAGCANPVNRATSDSYSELCSTAERQGQLARAEEACYRALVNTDWGNLGAEIKSQKLYNLARIKRRLAKFKEAEDLLAQSLTIENNLAPPSKLKIARRQVELSVNLAAQGKWSEGSQVLTKVLPVCDLFEGQERGYAADVLHHFADELKKTNDIDLAFSFEKKASVLEK